MKLKKNYNIDDRGNLITSLWRTPLIKLWKIISIETQRNYRTFCWSFFSVFIIPSCSIFFYLSQPWLQHSLWLTFIASNTLNTTRKRYKNNKQCPIFCGRIISTFLEFIYILIKNIACPCLHFFINPYPNSRKSTSPLYTTCKDPKNPKKKHDTRAQKHLKHVSHLRSTYRSRESKETEWEVVIVEAATRCFHSLTTFPIGNEKRGVW